MTINITIDTDTEFNIFHAECKSVESAVQELYRFERNILPKIGKPEMIEDIAF